MHLDRVPRQLVAEYQPNFLAKSDRVMVTGLLAYSTSTAGRTSDCDKRSAAEIEVGAALKLATAKVEQASERGNGEGTQGRERQDEPGVDFNDAPGLIESVVGALGLQP